MKTILAFIICSLFVACTPQPTSIETKRSEPIQLSYSPEDTLEAIELAVWLTTELTPPDSVVSKMLYNINHLRSSFKDSVNLQSCLSLRFLTPWLTNCILVKFDSITADLVRNKEYSGWTLLPDSVKPDSVDPPDDLGWTLARYSRILNPWRLCDYFASLPGVVICEPNGRWFAGGTYPIFPGLRSGEMSYLFVVNHFFGLGLYHYFYYENEKPKYAGVWSNSQNPKPSFWYDAKASIDSFYIWGKNG